MPISDEEHDRRVSELLAANNREVERRRDAERALKFYADESHYELRDLMKVPPAELAVDRNGWWPANKFAPAVLAEGGALARAVLL